MVLYGTTLSGVRNWITMAIMNITFIYIMMDFGTICPKRGCGGVYSEEPIGCNQSRLQHPLASHPQNPQVNPPLSLLLSHLANPLVNPPLSLLQTHLVSHLANLLQIHLTLQTQIL